MKLGPEAQLQASVARFLDEHLPPDVMWCASLSGLRMPIHVAARAKAQGVRRGWPDLSFAIPGVGLRMIELKAGQSLSPEQRRMRDILQPLGLWALCRSVEEVAGALTGWGVKLQESVIWKSH